MFNKMRRFRQLLSEEENVQILTAGTNGVLALCGDDGMPYAVPLSYVYDNGKIYFHGAKSGAKHDIIAQNNKASFCVVGQDQNVPEKFTTYFKSVIAFGKVSVVTDEDEIYHAVDILALKYSPSESDAARDAEIKREWNALCVLRLDIEEMTGKQAIELVK